MTYSYSTLPLKLFFDGILVDTEVAPQVPIDWSTANNIYINRSYTNTPLRDTQYHRIAVIDRILTDEEIVKIYQDIGESL